MPITVADLQARLSVDLGDVQGKLRQAIQGLQAAEDATKKLASSLDKDVSNAAKNAGASLNTFRDSAKRAFEVFVGVNLATVFERGVVAIKEYIAEASKLGREQQLQEATFKSFASSIGVAGEALSAQIQKVSGDTMDAGEAMKVAMRGLQEGLQPGQLIALTDTARQLAKSMQVDVVTAFQELTEAIATGQSRKLREIGITIDMDEALKKYAASQRATVEQLGTAQRSQALLIAVMAKSAPVVESNRKVNDEWGESLQRLSVAWKDVQQTVGIFVNEQALKVLQWIGTLKKDIGDLGPAVAEFGRIWGATWSLITSNFKKTEDNLSGLKQVIGEVQMAIGAIGVGLGALFMVTAGAAAGITSLLEDLSKRRLPDLGKAMETAVAAQKAAWATWDASRKALGEMGAKLADTSTTTKEVAASTNLGTSALDGQRAALKAIVVNFDALEKAMQALKDQALAQTLSEDGAKMLTLTAGVRQAADATKGLSAADKATWTARANAIAENIVAGDKLAEQLKDINALVKAGMNESPTQSPIGAQIQGLDDAAAMFDVYKDEVALATEQIALTETAIKAVTKEYGADSEAVATLTAELQNYKANLEEANRVAGIAASVQEAWRGKVEETVDPVAQLVTELHAAQNEALTFGAGMTSTAAEISATEKALKALASEFGDTDPAVMRLRDDLEALKATRFQETLAAITVEAKLVGPEFDEVAARLGAVRAEMLRTAQAAGGELTPAVAALKAEFDRLSEIQKTRAFFVDIFGSIQGGIAKMIEGLQLGTRKWKDFGAMALDVLRSIAAEILNRLIKQALDPFIARLAAVASGAVTGGSGGGGMNSAGFAPGEAGGAPVSGGSSIPGIPTGVFDFGTLFNLWSGLTNGVSAFNEALDAGYGAMTGLTSAWDTFGTAMSGATSSLTIGLAGVGAAVSAFSTIMDFVNGRTSEAIGGVAGAAVGGVAGGLVGTYVFPGVGTALGALVGSVLGDTIGSWLGGMFGGPSNYQLKRMQAGDEANAALGNVTGGYAAALNTGNAAAVLAALTGGGGGASGNSVRTELVLPQGLATKIGLTGQQIGDEIVTQWSALTLEQFQKVIAAIKEQPELADAIRGSGDVPYLAGGDAAAIAEQIRNGAIALVKAFSELDAVRDRISQLAVDLSDAAKDVLPPAAASAFSDNIIGPLRDRMLAVLSSGIPAKEMQKQLDALAKEMQAYVGIVDLYGQLNQNIAQLAGDFAGQLNAAVSAIEQTLTAADRAVSMAQATARRAVGPEAVLRANTALQDAVLKRYQTEMQLVAQVQAAIKNTIQSIMKPASDNAIMAGISLLAMGDATALDALTTSLADLAMAAPDVTEKIYAIGQGFAAVLAALPVRAQAFATTAENLASAVGPDATTGPAPMLAQLSASVAPFLGALKDLVEQARATGDLAGEVTLLQQQAEAFKAIGAAAVQAVTEWAKAVADATRAKAAEMVADINKNWDALEQTSRDAADAMKADVTKNWDALEKLVTDTAEGEIKRIETQRDAELALNQAVIDSNNLRLTGIAKEQAGIRDKLDADLAANQVLIDANNARLKGIQAEQEALQTALVAAQAWRQAVTAVGDYITQLERSMMSPEMQFTSAQGDYQSALSAYRAKPSAAGLTEVQQLAQALLQSAGSMPGTDTKGLTQQIIGDLKAAKALAPADTVDAIQAQLAALDQQTKVLQASNEALAELNKGLRDTAAAQLKTLDDEAKLLTESNATLTKINQQIKDSATDAITAIKDKLTEDLKAIDTARKHDLEVVDAWLKAQLFYIDEGRKYDLGLVNVWLTGQLLAIDKIAKDAITDITTGIANSLLENSKRQYDIAQVLLGAQRTQLDAITKGVPLQQFMADAASRTATALEKIRDDLGDFLLAADGAAPMPVLALGSPYIPQDGPAYLHQGEAVLTKEENARGRGGDVHIQIIMAPGETFEDMETKLEHSIRWGRLGKVIAGKP